MIKFLFKLLFELIKAFSYWFIITTILVYYVFFVEPKQLSNEIHTIYDTKINQDTKIVQFSDVHINKWTTSDFLTNLVTNINNENPDIVIFTGDLFDNYYNDEKQIIEKESFIIEQLSQINAKYGKFAIIGNHDCNNKINLEYYEHILKETGFILLTGENIENYSCTIEELNLNIFGINTSNKNEWDKTLNKGNNEKKLNLLLLHAPDYINNMNIENIDYAFAGHTHGGQVNVPYLKKYVLPKGGETYVKGEYLINNNTKLYVNSGIGTTRIPVRFLMKPQISIYNIIKD